MVVPVRWSASLARLGSGIVAVTARIESARLHLGSELSKRHSDPVEFEEKD
jgi:hypothetical protein